ncbi:hypothetical protein IAT38_002669 [Cryptococcus sp. DSM 104549]
MSDNQQQQATNNAGGGGILGNLSGASQAFDGQQDALDKAVGAGLKQFGYSDNEAVTEGVSDQIRTQFKNITGKDIPIEDK